MAKNVPLEKKKFVKKQTGQTLIEGYINKNNQENYGCTGKEGNHEGQLLYRMKCLDCGYEYEANALNEMRWIDYGSKL